MAHRSPPRRFVPLHRAARYLATESCWASAYRESDGDWSERLAEDLRYAIVAGDIRTRGHRKDPNQMVERAVTDIGAPFWDRAEWDVGLVTAAEPVHIIRRSYGEGDEFWFVALDEEQLHARWPRASWLARLSGRSPIKPRDYAAVWAAQDKAYGKIAKGNT